MVFDYILEEHVAEKVDHWFDLHDGETQRFQQRFAENLDEEERDGYTESNRKRMVYFQLAINRSYTIVRYSRTLGHCIYVTNSTD